MSAVTVVIPNWNGESHLRECLDSMRCQTWTDFEVLLVDNGSEDRSVALVRDTYPEVLVIETGSNLGFAGAVNAGIRASGSDLIALLNNDTRVEPRWLEELVGAAARFPDAAAFASLMVFYDRRDIVNAAGDEFLMRMGTAVNRGFGKRVSEFLAPAWVFGASAGASMYRRGFFDQVGLFDEQYFLMHEDTDLNMRGQRAGLKTLYVPAAVVAHKLSASINSQPALNMARLRWRNEALVVTKTLPAPMVARGLLALAWRDVRETFALRPSAWRGTGERLRRYPSRVKARLDGARIGFRSRRALERSRASARALRKSFRAHLI